MDSTIAGFMQQPFFGTLMLMICGSGLLLLFSVVGIAYSRSRRSSAQVDAPPVKEKRKTTPPPDDLPPEPAVESDLPDLAALVSAPPPVEPAPPVRKRRPGTFTVDLQEGGAVEAVEVMTIMRDVVSGGLIVQIGNKAYEDMSRAPDFRGSFLKIMRELSPQVTAPPAPPAPPPPAPAEEAPAPDTSVDESAPDDAPVAEPAAEDISSDASPPLEPLVIEQNAAPPAAAPKTPAAGHLPGDLPRYKETEYTEVKESGGLFRRKKLEVKPIPELDIAGAIESFIQHKLGQMPIFADRSIHVLPAPDGGVSIEVDGRYYDAVGDVEDQAVRDFLAASIQEWQSRQ